MEIIVNLRESFFESLSPFLFYLKIISVLISSILIGMAIYIAPKLYKIFFPAKLNMDVTDEDKWDRPRTIRIWTQILDRLKKGDESNIKMAIIEADKVLDEILKRSGIEGATMGERLKKLTIAQLRNLDAIWSAHNLRNRIVHEPDFSPSISDANFAIKVYEEAFKEFKLID